MISTFWILVPDALIMQSIRERLNKKDCLTKGWIMIGFPRTRDQAESLARVPLMAPTRYEEKKTQSFHFYLSLEFSFWIYHWMLHSNV
jgi:adenylate kinase family enzyme